MSDKHTPKAVIELAQKLYAQHKKDGTLKQKPGLGAVPGRVVHTAGDVTWTDYLPDARQIYFQRK